MKIPKELGLKIWEAGLAYKDEEFKDSPNGFHTAPWVNEDAMAIAFEAGAEWLWHEINKLQQEDPGVEDKSD